MSNLINKIERKKKIYINNKCKNMNIKTFEKHKNNPPYKFYYIFDINTKGDAKAFLISDKNQFQDNLKNKVTKSQTGYCVGITNPFKIHINNKTYCINPNSSTIIKIKINKTKYIKKFEIGQIIYKLYHENDSNFRLFDIENNRLFEYHNKQNNTNTNTKSSFLHLYNYEVEYFQELLENMPIYNNGYVDYDDESSNRRSYPFVIKYQMHEILNNNNLENNSFVKTTSKFNKNLNLKEKSNSYKKNIIRKKVFFSKETMKIKNLNNENNYKSSSSINYPKFIESLNGDEDKETIKSLYQLYLKKKSREIIKRHRQKNNNNNNQIYKHLNDRFNDLLEENTAILTGYFNEKKIIKGVNCHTIDSNKKDNEYLPIIFNIKTNKNVILIGDIRGSFHSFFRIFIRLLKKEIIGNDLKLNDNYQLIFLGNIIHRGYFSYECLILIFLLMKKNNTKEELNVIYNKGSFEHSKYPGKKLHDELLQKRKTGNTEENIFNFFENYLSQAIILNHNNTKYWLCNGGFPFSKNLLPINFSKYESYDIIKLKYSNDHILINMFHRLPETTPDLSSNIIEKREMINAQYDHNRFLRGKKNIVHKQYRYYDWVKLKIGTNDLKKFLKMNKINFIIRSNNDSYFDDYRNRYWNDSLLIDNKDQGQYLPLSLKTSYNILKYYNRITTFKYNIDINNTNNVLKKSDGSFMTINPNSNKFLQKDELTLYPVLTISTNSDYNSPLFHDSFVVLKNTRDNKNL